MASVEPSRRFDSLMTTVTTPQTDEVIVVRDLHKTFGAVPALRGVSLTVRRGEVIVVIGPSGCGKSTLLRCLNHLEVPTAGEVYINDVHLEDKRTDINSVRAEVGMVFQQFNLFGHLTALENIMLAQTLVRKRDKAEAEKIARRFHHLGFQLYATEGTAAYLEKRGLPVIAVAKIGEGERTVLSLITNGEVQFVINTITSGKQQRTDGFRIRREAVEHGVISLTNLDTADAILTVINSMTLTANTIGAQEVR